MLATSSYFAEDAVRGTDKPAGSGWFSLAIGAASILTVIVFWHLGKDVRSISPNYVLAGWLIFSGLMMGAWGIVRINSTNAKNDLRVGQDTINFCVAMIAVTFAILAIVLQK